MKLGNLACVARKDAAEWLSDRDSRRGFLVQSAILFAMLGIFVPWTTPGIWASPGEVVILYVVFPSLIASMLSADAFAGEKERHTLESLLATPLTDAELFFGKVSAAAGLATAVSLLTVLVSTLVVALKTRGAAAVLPTVGEEASIVLGSLGAALAISALAVLVSSRVTVARSAQQLVQVLFLLFSAITGYLIRNSNGELTWRLIPFGSLTLVLLGLALLTLARTLFSRERLIARL